MQAHDGLSNHGERKHAKEQEQDARASAVHVSSKHLYCIYPKFICEKRENLFSSLAPEQRSHHD